MIEINDTKLTHYEQRLEQARLAAEQASSAAARELHLKIAAICERQLEMMRTKN